MLSPAPVYEKRLCSCGLFFLALEDSASPFCPDCNNEISHPFVIIDHKVRNRKYYHRYYQEHKEEEKAIQRHYYQNHKEECRARVRRWRQEHKDEEKLYRRRYYQEHKE